MLGTKARGGASDLFPRRGALRGGTVAKGAWGLYVDLVSRLPIPSVDRILQYLAKQRDAFHPRLHATQRLVEAIPYGMFGNVRAALYRAAGFRIGSKVYIHGPLTLRGRGDIYQRLTIGELTTVNSPCYLDLNAPVTIGSRCGIGHHLVLVTSNHALGPSKERRGDLTPLPVTIGDGVWLGARVLILPGVTIGHGAFVAAGSVVTRDVPPNVRVAGHPAVVVAELGGEGAPRSRRWIGRPRIERRAVR